MGFPFSAIGLASALFFLQVRHRLPFDTRGGDVESKPWSPALLTGCDGGGKTFEICQDTAVAHRGSRIGEANVGGNNVGVTEMNSALPSMHRSFLQLGSAMTGSDIHNDQHRERVADVAMHNDQHRERVADVAMHNAQHRERVTLADVATARMWSAHRVANVVPQAINSSSAASSAKMPRRAIVMGPQVAAKGGERRLHTASTDHPPKIEVNGGRIAARSEAKAANGLDGSVSFEGAVSDACWLNAADMWQSVKSIQFLSRARRCLHQSTAASTMIVLLVAGLAMALFGAALFLTRINSTGGGGQDWAEDAKLRGPASAREAAYRGARENSMTDLGRGGRGSFKGGSATPPYGGSKPAFSNYPSAADPSSTHPFGQNPSSRHLTPQPSYHSNPSSHQASPAPAQRMPSSRTAVPSGPPVSTMPADASAPPTPTLPNRGPEQLCPGLVVPAGNECVVAVPVKAPTSTGAITTFNVCETNGAPVIQVELTMPVWAGAAAEGRPIVLLRAAQGPKPLIAYCKTGPESGGRRSVYVYDHHDELFAHVAKVMTLTDSRPQLNRSRTTPDLSRPCYVLTSGRIGLQLLFDGNFREHAVNITDDRRKILADAEPCTMKFDTSVPYYKLRVKENVDVGLILCALLSIDQMEAR